MVDVFYLKQNALYSNANEQERSSSTPETSMPSSFKSANVILPICSFLAVLSRNAVAEESAPAPAPVQESNNTMTVIGQLNAVRNQISPSLGATTYDVDQDQILSEAQGADAPFNEILLRMPGMAQDSFGQVHLRGEHANIQFRIDGILLPEGITTFGQEIDTRFADDVTLITGSLPAQYGLRTAGIVDITTKSGAYNPGGELSLSGGSFDTSRASASYGGTAGHLDFYATASALHDDLGIENPTSGRSAIHDESTQYRGFAYFSYLINENSRISLITSGSDGTFQIPDNPGQIPVFTVAGAPPPNSATIDENQLERNSYAVVAYQFSLGDANLQIAPFIRESQVIFTPDFDQDLAFNGVAGWLDQRAFTAGIQVDSSLRVSEEHTLRAGGFYASTRAIEDTSTAVFTADASGSQTSMTPETINDDNSKVGSLSSLYWQDEWRIVKAWTLNYGLRFDNVNAYVNQNQVSPRINSTLAMTATTTVHCGYSHFFTPPPLESVSQETVAAFNGTTNQASAPYSDPVKAERSNYFDGGVTQRVGGHLSLGLDGYYKQSDDQLDLGQFGQAVIFAPFNYREGRILGTEVTACYQDHEWTTFTNVALSRSQGKGIDSAEFQFSPQELAYAKNHWINMDHDQRWSVSVGASYQFPTNTRLSIDGIGGTGLRDGFDNTDHLPAYATINLGLTQGYHDLTARVDVVNLLDRVYEIRNGTGVGVANDPQYGQRRGLYGGLTYKF